MAELSYSVTVTLADVSVSRLGQEILRGVSCTLAPGAALVLTGANGSGKTSLIRAIAGFARAGGEILFHQDGEALPPAEAASRHVHLIGHDNGLNRRQSALDHLGFWRDLLGTGETADRAPDLAQILAEAGLADGPVWRLSAGQRQRLALARLLVAPRAVWLLDEPVTALDAAGRDLLARLCDDHRARGGIVVTSSHGLMRIGDALTLTLQQQAGAAA